MLSDTENKRASERKQLGDGVPAQVRIDHRLVRCSVRDVSYTGAMLAFEEEVQLPPQVMLSFGAKPGAPRLCRVVWQKGRTAGVAFRKR